MSKLNETIRRAQAKRDQRIKRWLAQGKKQTEIAALLHISKQRVNQIMARIKGRKGKS